MTPRFPILHPSLAPAYEYVFSCVSGFQLRRSCLKVSQDPRFPSGIHCYATLKGRRAGPVHCSQQHTQSRPQRNPPPGPRTSSNASQEAPPPHPTGLFNLNRFISIFRRSFLRRIFFGSDVPSKPFKHNLTTTQEIYAKFSYPVRFLF